MRAMDSHRYDREKQVCFAVGMAAIDGGKPTDFTQRLLDDYTEGRISASGLRQAVLEKYAKVSR
ncbi:antitoxin VbhA family protein [Sporosarcina soli]|jgi:hypothetical protein|uniref:Antitoxin VbhA family protein n=1 Tax=Sporosarcina soli TaxID=334736 RepID=A0ABW0TPI2_9BACL